MKNRLGARPRQAQPDLGAEVALDQGDHGQHGETGAERHDHAGSTRARPVQIGERDAHAGTAAPADQPHAAQHQHGKAGQKHGRGQRHGDEDQPEPAVGDAEQGKRRKARDAEPSSTRTGAAAGSRRHDQGRNMPAGDTSRARASGQITKASAVSRPQPAAISSGIG